EHDGAPLKMPIVKQQLFGLKCTVRIPASWAGKQVRLVIEQPDVTRRSIEGVFINGDGYLRNSAWYPVGVRLDRWLHPGQDNEIMLLGKGHQNMEEYKGFLANISAVRLEVLP
ncbi:MAG TPA: hypothetical protein VGM23_12705, partial [Armatimonadota bacterium]